MKRSILVLTIIVGLLAMAAISVSGGAKASPPVTKHYKVRCTDNNQSLYFVIRETDGTLNGGFMYVENMQVATVTAAYAGTGVIRAKVNGNTVAIGFELHKTGAILVASYVPGNVKRVKICTADYKYE
ncbi:MAG: hypothetical protein H0U54_04325 [Acidobacteria bacterium]|jgi:hypothetical protein|nr:hypothetical protein [Acidobacteriota bacterium]